MEDYKKVSFDIFLRDSLVTGFISEKTPMELVQIIWERLKPPEEINKETAFYAPWPFYAIGGQEIKIPSGFQKNGNHIILTAKYKLNTCVSDGDRIKSYAIQGV